VVDVPVAYRNVGHLAVMVPGVSFGTRMGRTTGSTSRTARQTRRSRSRSMAST
jgi:hypothetical protein